LNLELTNKPVLVCASSAGLGKATALEFAREGATVMLCGRDGARLQRAAAEINAASGRQPHWTVADLSRPQDIAHLIEATVSACGGLYTLVYNSGGPPAGGFDQFDDAAWHSAYEQNLLGCVRTIRAALPHLRRGGGGRIVNFASTSVKSPIDNLILSNTFRTGVLGLTKSLAAELAADAILVNLLGPGRIQTARTEQLDALRAQRAGVSVEQIRADACRNIPLRRYGTAPELAKVAVFLGSPVNTYITGQTLLVDGGMVKAY
jgi:3-oxoacyl-[acyl-carrier protein] reductase